jgi:hypothetical protein
MRPPSIRLFEKLYLLTIAIGLVALALSWNSITGLAQARTGQDAANGVLIVAAVLGVLIPLLLLYFIARRASNVAKWIFVVLAAFSVLSFVAGAANPELPKDALFALNVASLLLTLYCAWLLFRPDARAWLEHRGDGTSSEDVIG